MKIKPISCPNCGAGLQLESRDPLVTCPHCDTSMMIEWPEIRQRNFIMKSPSSPVVTCPVCSAQQFRSDELADKNVACIECGEVSKMPAIVGHQLKFCNICDRFYFSYEARCPGWRSHDLG